jgi:hypothetical protein
MTNSNTAHFPIYNTGDRYSVVLHSVQCTMSGTHQYNQTAMQACSSNSNTATRDSVYTGHRDTQSGKLADQRTVHLSSTGSHPLHYIFVIFVINTLK